MPSNIDVDIDMARFSPRVRGKRRNIGLTMMAVRALLNAALLITVAVGLHRGISWLARANNCLYWFVALFCWRYLRFVVNLAAF